MKLLWLLISFFILKRELKLFFLFVEVVRYYELLLIFYYLGIYEVIDYCFVRK